MEDRRHIKLEKVGCAFGRYGEVLQNKVLPIRFRFSLAQDSKKAGEQAIATFRFSLAQDSKKAGDSLSPHFGYAWVRRLKL
ncbi:hypothetical protein PoB_002701000 [Plakobranchus ocellatus]|uniref:Uncharacterized protein n=1 Tax=Plakobranchus ocellatus TaxID=259542 RepID=A0AAV3ZXA9_9GAST|nr:hypothetical protein PoB_002701000 [Plakobranchus ocellatus]